MAISEKTKICFVSSIPNTLYFYLELLKILKAIGAEITLLSSENPMLYDLQKKLDCRICAVEISRSISPWKDLHAYRFMKEFFEKGKYDLIHAHTPKAGLLAMIASCHAGIAVRLYTIHGLLLETADGLRKIIFRKCEQIACRRATKVLSVSKSLRDRILQENICLEGKITVLGDGSACGVDFKIYSRSDSVLQKAQEIRRRFQIPMGATVLGFVGRITPDKGIPLLVNSFWELSKDKPDLHLIMVGRIDKDRESLDRITSSLIQDHPRIHMAGHIPYPVEYYAAMDIFVMPSKREGFGMCNIEAAAMGLPVVASRIPGCVDSVLDGETGLLFEVNNQNEFIVALKNLIENPGMRKKMGLSGSMRVQRHFTSEHLVHEHLNLYEILLKEEENII